MNTIRLYTETNRYMGWLKATKKNKSNFISWINSGHYLKQGNKIIKSLKEIEF